MFLFAKALVILVGLPIGGFIHIRKSSDTGIFEISLISRAPRWVPSFHY
jgi:hypothetical protein